MKIRIIFSIYAALLAVALMFSKSSVAGGGPGGIGPISLPPPTMADSPQKPSADCVAGGLTSGSFMVEPGDAAMIISAPILGYCTSGAVKTATTTWAQPPQTYLYCKAAEFMPYAAGVKLCAVAKERLEQISTNIKLMEKIDANIAQLKATQVELNKLKLCVKANQSCAGL